MAGVWAKGLGLGHMLTQQKYGREGGGMVYLELIFTNFFTFLDYIFHKLGKGRFTIRHTYTACIVR